MLPLTEEENKSHSKQKICHMCRKKINNKIYWKVQDHDNYTGKYRGVVYLICSLRNKNEFPVILHKGSKRSLNV